MAVLGSSLNTQPINDLNNELQRRDDDPGSTVGLWFPTHVSSCACSGACATDCTHTRQDEIDSQTKTASVKDWVNETSQLQEEDGVPVPICHPQGAESSLNVETAQNLNHSTQGTNSQMTVREGLALSQHSQELFTNTSNYHISPQRSDTISLIIEKYRSTLQQDVEPQEIVDPAPQVNSSRRDVSPVGRLDSQLRMCSFISTCYPMFEIVLRWTDNTQISALYEKINDTAIETFKPSAADPNEHQSLVAQESVDPRPIWGVPSNVNYLGSENECSLSSLDSDYSEEDVVHWEMRSTPLASPKGCEDVATKRASETSKDHLKGTSQSGKTSRRNLPITSGFRAKNQVPRGLVRGQPRRPGELTPEEKKARIWESYHTLYDARIPLEFGPNSDNVFNPYRLNTINLVLSGKVLIPRNLEDTDHELDTLLDFLPSDLDDRDLKTMTSKTFLQDLFERTYSPQRNLFDILRSLYNGVKGVDVSKRLTEFFAYSVLRVTECTVEPEEVRMSFI